MMAIITLDTREGRRARHGRRAVPSDEEVMMHVTAIRAVPKILVGACGVVRHRGFEECEARLDALETAGAIVERLEATADTTGVFPLVTVNDVVVSRGRHPTPTEWAHAIGEAVREAGPAARRLNRSQGLGCFS